MPESPTFGEWLEQRRGRYPNTHSRWTDVEDLRLVYELAGGIGWEKIAVLHGRTVKAVRLRARKVLEVQDA